MPRNKVTFILPVYNSLSRINTGSSHLQEAIASALNQTHPYVELVILDNQSTDGTPEMCEQFTAKDPRVRIVIDTERRSIEEAYNKLAQLASGDWVVHLNDDDWFDRQYLEKLFAQANPGLSMVYSNGVNVSVTGTVLGELLPNKCHAPYVGPPNADFCRAIAQRHVNPIMFGPVRTQAYQSLRPIRPFDPLEANMDNLFLAKFFLWGYRAKFIDEPLVKYRMRPRPLDTTKIPGMPDHPISIYLYYIRHQFLFYHAVQALIDQCKFAEIEERVLKIVAFQSCICHSVQLANWIYHEITQTDEQKVAVQQFVTRMKAANPYLFTTFYPAWSLHLERTLGILRSKFFEAVQYLTQLSPNPEITTTIERLLCL